MPADFEKCVAGKGRVRTKKLKGGKYIHLCFDKSGSHAGEVKTVQGTFDMAADHEHMMDPYRHMKR